MGITLPAASFLVYLICHAQSRKFSEGTVLPYHFPSSPCLGSALSMAGGGSGAQAARPPSGGGLLSIPRTAGSDRWLQGHKHLLTHQAEQQWPGALGSCSQVAKKNLNQKCGVFATQTRVPCCEFTPGNLQ